MTYLFWAFTAVWLGIFLYLYALMRRTEALSREIEALRASRRPAPAPADRVGMRP